MAIEEIVKRLSLEDILFGRAGLAEIEERLAVLRRKIDLENPRPSKYAESVFSKGQLHYKGNPTNGMRRVLETLGPYVKGKRPKVSVVVPTYNRTDLVKRCIDSLLKQTGFNNYEIIVVDDGSKKDPIPELRNKYASHIKSGKVRLFRKKNGGVASARNAGLKLARGQYLSLIDSDDIALPTRLRDLVQYLDNHPKKDFVHARASTIDITGKRLKDAGPSKHFERFWNSGTLDRDAPKHLQSGTNCVHAQTTMFKRKVYDKMKDKKGRFFDEHLKNSEDFDAWVRVSEKFNMGFLNRGVARYTWHSGGKSNGDSRKQRILREVIKNKRKIRQQFGKDVRMLMFLPKTCGGIGHAATELAESLFEQGITNITFVKQPDWYPEKPVYYVKNLDSNIFSKHRTDKYHDQGWEKIEGNGKGAFDTLCKKLDINSFDLINIQSNHFKHELNWLRRKGIKTPVVYTCHSLIKYEEEREQRPRAGAVKYQECIMEKSDYIQAMSRSYRDIIRSRYPRFKDKIMVLPNGISFNDKKPERKPEGKILLNIGRLDHAKGQKYLISAMPNILKSNPDAVLYIAGEGNLRGKLEAQIRELGLEDKVKLLGNKTKKELDALRSKAALYVHSSVHENWPLTVNEAVRQQLPVVCTDVGGLQEMLVNNQEAFKVAAKDPRALATSINIALSNPNLAKMFATAAYNRFGQAFSSERVAQRAIEMYESIIKSSNSLRKYENSLK
jgi:glycosyltransferase involved in cell wall biosynthesis